MKTSSVSSHGRPFPRRNGCLLELSQPCQFLLLSNVSLGFLPSCWPSCNDSNDIMWFQLENDLQPSATRAHTDQLVPIFESLVPADFILGEEALDCFLESNAMIGKLVALKIILEVGRLERMPIYQGTPSSSRRQTRVSHPGSGRLCSFRCRPWISYLPAYRKRVDLVKQRLAPALASVLTTFSRLEQPANYASRIPTNKNAVDKVRFTMHQTISSLFVNCRNGTSRLRLTTLICLRAHTA